MYASIRDFAGGAALFALTAFLAAGCATTIVRDEPLRISVAPGADVETSPLAEALLAHERGVSAEALEVEWKGKAFTAEVVLKGDGESLSVVLLAPQMRLATLVVSKPHRLEWERDRRVPRSLDPEMVLVDIAFARLPAAALAAALGDRFAVSDDGRRRSVSFNSREIRTLERLEGGDRLFSNPSAGYVCRIVSMEAVP